MAQQSGRKGAQAQQKSETMSRDAYLKMISTSWRSFLRHICWGSPDPPLPPMPPPHQRAFGKMNDPPTPPRNPPPPPQHTPCLQTNNVDNILLNTQTSVHTRKYQLAHLLRPPLGTHCGSKIAPAARGPVSCWCWRTCRLYPRPARAFVRRPIIDRKRSPFMTPSFLLLFLELSFWSSLS